MSWEPLQSEILADGNPTPSATLYDHPGGKLLVVNAFVKGLGRKDIEVHYQFGDPKDPKSVSKAEAYLAEVVGGCPFQLGVYSSVALSRLGCNVKMT